MLGSRRPPDIFVSWGGGHLRALVEAGFVRDLTPEMGTGWATDFKPGSLANLVMDERVYAVPARMTLVSFWANRALLQDAGVAAADLETWSGLLAAVEKLKAAGITPMSVGGDEGWPMALYWSGLALALGGREAMDDAVVGVEQGFRDATFLEAGRRMRELTDLEPFQNGYLEMNENQAIGAFTDGHAAMLLNGDWVQARLMRAWRGDDPEADIVRVPFPPRDLMRDDTVVTLGGVGSWVIRDEAPEASEAFLRELAGIDAQRTLAAMGFGIPTIASADDALTDPIQQEVATTLTVTEYHQLFLDQVLGPVAGDLANDAIVDLASGRSSPDEAASAVEEAWAPYREAWGIADRDAVAPPVAAE